MATTAELPRLHVWMTWMNPCHCSTSSTLLYTTDTCHGIPRLPNQSAHDSWYLWGKNFIAQSLTMNTVSSLRASIASRRAWSWRADRSRWHFQDWMASTAELAWYTASSLSSSLSNDALATASEMAVRIDCRASHCLHVQTPVLVPFKWLNNGDFAAQWALHKRQILSLYSAMSMYTKFLHAKGPLLWTTHPFFSSLKGVCL